jgi:3-hydroxyacyl-CoA dehydrogenase
MLSEFGAGVQRQDKIAITHYFVPAHIVPGVEVGGGPGTSRKTLEVACGLMKKIRKVPVRVLKESPGCVVNRIQAALRREAFRVWAEGVATAEDIDLGVRATFGFRLPFDGPMTHYDLAGVWRWDREVRMGWAQKQFNAKEHGLSEEVAERIMHRLAKGIPWLVQPDKLEEKKSRIERQYIRCLKEWYRSEE